MGKRKKILFRIKMKLDLKSWCIIAAILLILAIPSGWPYGFYTFLRFAISITAVIVAWGFYKSHLPAWAFIFGSVAFLFNPLIPIHLSKSSWVPVDLISAVLFFLAAYSVKRKKQT